MRVLCVVCCVLRGCVWRDNYEVTRRRLDVVGQPPDAVAVALPHNDRAHEHLNGADALQWDLALARGLVHAQLVAQLVLGDGVGVVDLVAEDDKGHLGELLHGQERVELGLGLGEALVVLSVDEEDDAVDFGEVVLPETARWQGLAMGYIIKECGGTYPAGDRPDQR